MPLFGSHLSVAGGMYKAVVAAANYGMQTVQIFTTSPRMFPRPPAAKSRTATPGKATSSAAGSEFPVAHPLKEEDIRLFREAIAEHGLQSPCSHDSYLINLGAPDPAQRQRSLQAFILELERAEALGLAGVVMHPGSYVSGSESESLRHIADSLNEAHQRTAGFAVETWVEVTAGQGTNLGNRFEHLQFLLQESTAPERIGVCLDTCHLFAAGYGLKTRAEYDETMGQLDELIGASRVRACHLNDSKKEHGSRVDRHEHLGEGHLGLEPFRFLLNDSRFADLPMYLETKKEVRDGEDMDVVNLRILKSLLKPS